MRLVLMLVLFIGMTASAQKPEKHPDVDTTFDDLDYDDLFNELDKLLDSLTAPRNFVMFNIGVGNSYFNYESKSSYSVEALKKITYAPSLSYFSKTGLGISATSVIVDDGVNLNPYQFNFTGSYDYLKNTKFLTGIAYTRFVTKDSLPFYTSPLKNELYAYFNYRKLWFKPSVAASYGWGSRSDYEDREEYITSLQLRRNGFTRINTKESVSDFSLLTSVRHDFYWLDVFTYNDHIRVTPQLTFTSGSQKFGFNQSSNTYATLLRSGANILYNTENVYLDNKLYFQPLALTFYLKTEYSIGKFYVQPQLILDYYFPATEKNLTTAFVVNAGVIF